MDGGTPYCMCDHYNTKSSTYQGECEAQGLQIQDNGWCAYFDAKLGFAAPGALVAYAAAAATGVLVGLVAGTREAA